MLGEPSAVATSACEMPTFTFFWTRPSVSARSLAEPSCCECCAAVMQPASAAQRGMNNRKFFIGCELVVVRGFGCERGQSYGLREARQDGRSERIIRQVCRNEEEDEGRGRLRFAPEGLSQAEGDAGF